MEQPLSLLDFIYFFYYVTCAPQNNVHEISLRCLLEGVYDRCQGASLKQIILACFFILWILID